MLLWPPSFIAGTVFALHEPTVITETLVIFGSCYRLVRKVNFSCKGKPDAATVSSSGPTSKSKTKPVQQEQLQLERICLPVRTNLSSYPPIGRPLRCGKLSEEM